MVPAAAVNPVILTRVDLHDQHLMLPSQEQTRSAFTLCRKALSRALAASRTQGFTSRPIVRLRVSVENLPEVLAISGGLSPMLTWRLLGREVMRVILSDFAYCAVADTAPAVPDNIQVACRTFLANAAGVSGSVQTLHTCKWTWTGGQADISRTAEI